MKKNNIFIIIGIVLLIISLITFSSRGLPYNTRGLTANYVDHLFYSLLTSIIGSFFIIIGINNKIK